MTHRVQGGHVPSEEGIKRARELGMMWAQMHPIVSSYIRATVRDFHRAEDVLQDTAATVAEKFSEYDPGRPFQPWVIGIARNKLLDYMRKHANDRHVFDETVIDQLGQAYSDRSTEITSMETALDECVKKVRGKSRKLLEMRYLRDLKPAQIASATGMTPNAVYVMLFRVRKLLESCIKKQLSSARSFTGDLKSEGGA